MCADYVCQMSWGIC